MAEDTSPHNCPAIENTDQDVPRQDGDHPDIKNTDEPPKSLTLNEASQDGDQDYLRLPPHLQNSDLSIAKACKDYTDSVKLTLNMINDNINATLCKNLQCLEELWEKIQARTLFLETNPSFLASLSYDRADIRIENVMEFDEIKISLKENVSQINDKLAEIETVHNRLFDLVFRKADESMERIVIGMQPSLSDHSTLIPTDYPININYSPALPADVSKGKPFEDLHLKLVQQLEATDSLEGFLKLMDRKPDTDHQPSQPKIPRRTTRTRCGNKNKQFNDNLEQKYTGSLWFFHGDGRKKHLNKCPQKGSSAILKRQTQSGKCPYVMLFGWHHVSFCQNYTKMSNDIAIFNNLAKLSYLVEKFHLNMLN